ncbi:outer membrane lipoprotein-sorting protein [candidate division KSB1 bacterium]|nr:outer membrane lipoprotein-sorting protein [candidate division KSB1 bacterium]
MKKLIGLLVLFIWTASSAQSLTASQIVERSQEAIKVRGVQGISVMRIIDEKGRERVRKIRQVTKLYDNGDTEKRLLRFMAPADVKGTGLLTYDYAEKDDDLWLYMPALRKTRRIVSTEKAKNFMGSEFTYSDMTPPALEDFTFNLMEEEETGGTLCYTVEWIPNDDDIAEENGYSRRITFLGKEDFVVRKAVYFDLDGELLKQLIVHEVKELDPANHKFRAMHLEMVNEQNGRRSVMVNEQLEFNPDINDDYFTVRYLERE